MVFGAVILAYEFYIFIAKGRFGDFVVAVLNRFVFPDYETSYQVYQHVFRNYRESWFFAAVLILFFILLRAWLKGFIKYFKEINYGIDALIAENAGDVVLSPELAVTERKINSIKHTLAQRKLAGGGCRAAKERSCRLSGSRPENAADVGYRLPDTSA